MTLKQALMTLVVAAFAVSATRPAATEPSVGTLDGHPSYELPAAAVGLP